MKRTLKKIDGKGIEHNFGPLSENDINRILKGYKFNGLFYERNGTKCIFVVEEKSA